MLCAGPAPPRCDAVQVDKMCTLELSMDCLSVTRFRQSKRSKQKGEVVPRPEQNGQSDYHIYIYITITPTVFKTAQHLDAFHIYITAQHLDAFHPASRRSNHI